MGRLQFIQCVLAILIFFMPGTIAFGASEQSAWPLDRDEAWYLSNPGRRSCEVVLSWQLPGGGWPKGYDKTAPRPASGNSPSLDIATIDNKFTVQEIRFLARGYQLTKNPAYRAAVLKGLAFLQLAQYPTGGWPQRYQATDYGKCITFNDNGMTRVLELLSDIGKIEDFAWLDAEWKDQAWEMWERGMDCLLRCQIVQQGKLTAWAQQYDPLTLAPAPARSYELVGLAGAESSAILLYLMRLDHPSSQVQQAVHAGVDWFERVKITGKKLTVSDDEDLHLVDDPQGALLWARFYDLETMQPFYCGRDGVKKFALADIEAERRNGYAWIRASWGERVLKSYAVWAEKYPRPAADAAPAVPALTEK